MLSLILLSFLNSFFLDSRIEKHTRKLTMIYLEKSTVQLPLLFLRDAIFNTVNEDNPYPKERRALTGWWTNSSSFVLAE